MDTRRTDRDQQRDETRLPGEASAADRTRSVVSGRPLRYVLTMTLAECGPLTIPELATAIEQNGFTVHGRASKAISDALRWEISHGRVVRLERGRYGPGTMPRQTRAWIARRVDNLRATASAG